MANRARKKEIAKHEDPINVTCGGCRKVFAFKGSYECPECHYGKDPVKEIAFKGSYEGPECHYGKDPVKES